MTDGRVGIHDAPHRGQGQQPEKGESNMSITTLRSHPTVALHPLEIFAVHRGLAAPDETMHCVTCCEYRYSIHNNHKAWPRFQPVRPGRLVSRGVLRASLYELHQRFALLLYPFCSPHTFACGGNKLTDVETALVDDFGPVRDTLFLPLKQAVV